MQTDHYPDNTALHLAVLNDHANIVNELLALTDKLGKTWDLLSIQNMYDITALQYATRRGHIDIVYALLAAADKTGKASEMIAMKNKLGPRGETALLQAKQYGKDHIVKLLELWDQGKISYKVNIKNDTKINKNDDVDNIELALSCVCEADKELKQMIFFDLSAPDKLFESIRSKIPSSNQPLAEDKVKKIAERLQISLTTAGISLLDIKGAYNKTVLNFASGQNGNLDCVKIIILAAGNNVWELISFRPLGYGSTTAFHMASFNGHLDIVNEILATAHKLGKTWELLSMQNYEGATPLHSALRAGNIDIVYKLLLAADKIDKTSELISMKYKCGQGIEKALWRAEYYRRFSFNGEKKIPELLESWLLGGVKGKIDDIIKDNPAKGNEDIDFDIIFLDDVTGGSCDDYMPEFIKLNCSDRNEALLKLSGDALDEGRTLREECGCVFLEADCGCKLLLDNCGCKKAIDQIDGCKVYLCSECLKFTQPFGKIIYSPFFAQQFKLCRLSDSSIVATLNVAL